jgi:hypothetical protein
MSASSPTGINSENTRANVPSAMETTAGHASRSPARARAPMRQARCAGTTRPATAPPRAGVTGPAGPLAWPLPAVTAPVPASPGRGRAFVMSRLPMSVVPRAGPAGRSPALPANIRDMSRNRQGEDVICHVMAREKAAAVASDGSSGSRDRRSRLARRARLPAAAGIRGAGASRGLAEDHVSARPPRQHRRSRQRDRAAGARLAGAWHGHSRPDVRSRCRRRRGCRPRRVCRRRDGARRRYRPGGRRLQLCLRLARR